MQISQTINFNINHQHNLSPLTLKVRGDFFCSELNIDQGTRNVE